MGGDVLLPFISEIFKKKAKKEANIDIIFNQAVRLLNQNSILAHNFLIYELRNELREKGDLQFRAYTIPFNEANKTGESKGLKELTTFPWEFSFVKEDKIENKSTIQEAGISVKIGAKFYHLPDFIMLQEAKIEYTPDFYNLLNLRERLLEEINMYDTYANLTPSEKKALNVVILKN